MAGRIDKGFTLIELLIAITVFAVMSVMAFGGMRSVFNARQHTDDDAARLQAVQMALLHLQRDLGYIANRTIRDEFGTEQPPIAIADSGIYRLEFTRDGYQHGFLKNPELKVERSSSVQRIAYTIEDETLYRLYWPVLDRATDTQPHKQKLLDGVEAVEIRAADIQAEWHTSWPPLQPSGPFPRAVEVNLELQDWGRLMRLFVLPESA